MSKIKLRGRIKLVRLFTVCGQLSICRVGVGSRVSRIFPGDNLLSQLQTEQTECSMECIST